MTKFANPDPIAEAQARVRLRYMRGKPARQPKTIALAAQRVARKALPDKGPALSRLKLRWAEIVGERIAKYTRPEALSSSKTAKTLTLRVLPAAAPLVQHQSETIRQRVSVAAGGSITKLKLVQGPLGDARRDAPRPRPRPLTAAERAELETSLAGVTDPALRAALLSLGEAVIAASR